MPSTTEHRNAASSLLDSNKYSDLVITCEGRKFMVHKAILCPMSKVISAEVDHSWAESKSGIIKQEEFDACTVTRMLQYVYFQDYDVDGAHNMIDTADAQAGTENTVSSSTVSKALTETTLSDDHTEPTQTEQTTITLSNNQGMICHVQAYAIGEYYDMPGLKSLALEKFKQERVSFQDATGFIGLMESIAELAPASDSRFFDTICATAMESSDTEWTTAWNDKTLSESFQSNPNMQNSWLHAPSTSARAAISFAHSATRLARSMSTWFRARAMQSSTRKILRHDSLSFWLPWVRNAVSSRESKRIWQRQDMHCRLLHNGWAL